MDYRAAALKAIDAAYEEAIHRLFDATLAHLTGKQAPPDDAKTIEAIIGVHKQMTKLIEDAEI